MKIKKILLPFSEKESSLNKYWWHRLFSVAFLILLVLIPILIFSRLNASNVKNRTNCLSFTSGYGNETYYNENKFEAITEQQMKLEEHKNLYDINHYNAEQDRLQKEWDNLYKEAEEKINNCHSISQNIAKQNFLITFLLIFLSWYLLQIIYYKILLYIAFGSKKHN